MASTSLATSHRIIQDAKSLVETIEQWHLLNVQRSCKNSSSTLDFTSLDAGLDSLVDAGDLVRTSLGQHVAEVRRWRNSQLPIHHRLPPEIFVQIIRESLYHGYRYYLEAVNSLSTVSHAWRQVVNGTPSLWTTISSTSHPKFVDKALTYSNTSPLDITYSHDSCHDLGKHKFPTQIEPHQARCRSLRLSLESELQIPDFISVKAPAPLLERLQIDVFRFDEDCPVIDASEAAMPRLRHLQMEGAEPEFAQRSGLLSLSIRSVADHPPSMEDIMHLLHNSPEVQDLSLHGDFPLQNPDNTAPKQPIHLSHLRNLTLNNLASPDYSHLMSVINAPNLLAFSSSMGIVSTEVLAPTLQAMGTVLHHLAHTNGKVKIQLRSGELPSFFKASGRKLPADPQSAMEPTYDASIVISTSLEAQLCEFMVNYLFVDLPSPDVTLLLHGEDDPERWEMWLKSVPQIKTLQLSRGHTGQLMMQHLSVRGTDGWPCPVLKRLFVDCYHAGSNNNVLQMITSRYKRRPQDEDELPEPLDLLVLEVPAEEIEDKAWEEVKRIIGHDKVAVSTKRNHRMDPH